MYIISKIIENGNQDYPNYFESIKILNHSKSLDIIELELKKYVSKREIKIYRTQSKKLKKFNYMKFRDNIYVMETDSNGTAFIEPIKKEILKYFRKLKINKL